MHTRRLSSAAALVAVLFAAACEQPASSVRRDGEPRPDADLSMDVGVDGEFLRLQREVPGFAGHYFDGNGDLVVLLTDLRQEGTARALLGDVAADRPGAPGFTRAARVVVREVEHDFAALSRWHRRLGAVLNVDGVDFLDTDEAANRVVVGVTSDAAASEVRARAARLGIPPRAFAVQRVAAGRLAASLRDRIRPVKGGVGIRQYSENSECTLGFNVRYSNPMRGIPSGTRAFLTASHCTSGDFRAGGSLYQGGTIIGYDVVDPGLFDATTVSRCPAGARCRWSDAAVIRYEDTVPSSIGYLVKPLWSSAGSMGALDIHTDDSLRVVGRAYPSVGAYVHKIGWRTGWTYGPVLRTCTDYRWTDSTDGIPVWILCQTEVSGMATGGDSGAPAFMYSPDSNVTIAGIVWREIPADATSPHRFVFSGLEEIKKDVGSFVVY